MQKVSVIIPVYNLEKYVAGCIGSIQRQTYKNLQIIIVDDGSTDSTFRICRAIAENDLRIELYRIKHGGVAVARNTGLKHVAGELIFWVDGDDTINPSAIETLAKLLKQTHADMAKTELTKSTDNDKVIVYNKKEYMRKILTDEIKSYLAGTLFKKELFDEILFPDGMMVEDYAVYPEVVDKCKIIASTNINLYSYNKNRPGSETYIGRNRICGLWPRTYFTMKRYGRFKDEYKKECECILAQSVSYANITYMKMAGHRNYEEQRQAIYEFLKKNIREINENPYLSHYKKKVAVCIINHSCMIYLLKIMHEIKGCVQLMIKRRKLWK